MQPHCYHRKSRTQSDDLFRKSNTQQMGILAGKDSEKKSKLMWFNRRGASKRLKKPFRKKRRRFSHAVYAILRDLFERPDGAVKTPHLLAVLLLIKSILFFFALFLFRTSFRNRNRNPLTLINHHLLDICGRQRTNPQRCYNFSIKKEKRLDYDKRNNRRIEAGCR